MGMFNIGDNEIFRNILDAYPDEKQFASSNQATGSTQATAKKLQVLRTYADGSAALIQRAAPDLLEGMDASIYARAKQLLPPSVIDQQTDVNFMPDAQRLAQIDSKVLQDTMLAKTQALSGVMNQDTGAMPDESLSNNFKKAMGLTNDLIVSALKPDAKRNLALALKPILESFRNAYVNDLKVLAAELPAAKQAELQQAKLGEFKGLKPNEVQYIEKFQRLQLTDEQLGAIEKLIQVPEES